MREVGLADSSGGLDTTFDQITKYAKSCRFKDCTHMHEPGCAVLEAVENGEIDQSSYNNYLKMEKEQAYFDSTVAERRKKGKELSKTLKNYKKDMKRNNRL